MTTIKAQIMSCLLSCLSFILLQAVNGQAIDRHLLGLKLAALESRMNLHELFMDSSYQYALHYKVSTSQVITKAMFTQVLSHSFCQRILTYGFNPLVPKSNQHQFSPNNISRSTIVKVLRITKLITKGRML